MVVPIYHQDSQSIEIILEAQHIFIDETLNWIENHLEELTHLEDIKVVIQKYACLDQIRLQTLGTLIKQQQQFKKLSIIIENGSFLEQNGMSVVVEHLFLSQNLEELVVQIDADILSEVEVSSICTQIKQLNLIKRLDISIKGSCNISHQTFESLWKGINSQQALEVLVLNMNLSKVRDVKCFSDSIRNLTKLIELRISFQLNPISGVVDLFREIQYFVKLEILNLELSQPNIISQSEIEVLCESIGKLNKLKQIAFPSFYKQLRADRQIQLINKLTEKKLTQFSYELGSFNNSDLSSTLIQFLHQQSHLTSLNFKINKESKISKDFGVNFGEALQQFNLNELKFHLESSSEVNWFQKIADSFIKMTNLKTLEIYLSKQIQYQSQQTLGSINMNLKSLENLEHLSLQFYNVNIKQEDCNNFFLENLKKLRSLTLHFGDINGYSFIFSSLLGLPQLKNLEVLNIQDQIVFKIDNEDSDDFIDSLSHLKNLKQFRFSLILIPNFKPMKLIKCIQAMANLSELQVLDLNIKCGWTLELSKELGNTLSSLTKLQNLTLKFSESISLESLYELGKRIPGQSLKELSITLFSLYLDRFSIGLFEQTFAHLTVLDNLSIVSQNDILKDFNTCMYLEMLNCAKLITSLSVLKLKFVIRTVVKDKDVLVIKESFRSLKNLKVLNQELSVSKDLTESGLRQLCEGISSLKNLRVYDGYLDCDNQNIISVLTAFQSLQNLRKLNFNLRPCTFQKSKINLDIAISQNDLLFTNLNYLSLTINLNNNQKNQLKDFLFSLSSLKQLSFFLLQINEKYEISDDELEQLGLSLKHLSQLQQFIFYLFSHCELKVDSFRAFCEGLSCLANLEELTITISDTVEIDSPVSNLLYKACKKLAQLRSLSIYRYLKNEANENVELAIGLEHDPPLLPLQTLDLCFSNNEIIDCSSASSMKQVLMKSVNLEHLFMEFQEVHMSQEAFIFIAEGLSYLSNLTYLLIEIGQKIEFQEEAAQVLFSGIKNLVQLIELEISVDKSHPISFKVINDCFSDIKSLNKLEKLQIKHQLANQLVNQQEETNGFGEISKILKEKEIESVKLIITFLVDQIICAIEIENNFIFSYQVQFDVENSLYLSIFQNLFEYLKEKTSVEIYLTVDEENDDRIINFSQQFWSKIKAERMKLRYSGGSDLNQLIGITQGLLHLKNMKYLDYIVCTEEGGKNDEDTSLIVSLLANLNNLQRLHVSISDQQFYNQLFESLKKQLQNLREFSFYFQDYDQLDFSKRIYQKLMKIQPRLVLLSADEEQ